MADQKKSSKLGLGLLIGSVLGGIAAFFLSPKSGPENREEAKKLLAKARGWLKEEVAEVKKAVGKIDKKKYVEAVKKVLMRVENEVKKDSKEFAKIKKQLMKEWVRLRK
jgi:gas vesicle protein